MVLVRVVEDYDLIYAVMGYKKGGVGFPHVYGGVCPCVRSDC